MEIEGITWYEGAIDSEPAREKSAAEKRVDDHIDRCAACSTPGPCAALDRLIAGLLPHAR